MTKSDLLDLHPSCNVSVILYSLTDCYSLPHPPTLFLVFLVSCCLTLCPILSIAGVHTHCVLGPPHVHSPTHFPTQFKTLIYTFSLPFHLLFPPFSVNSL